MFGLDLTYRRKNLLIFIGFLLFMVLGYFLSFSKTIQLYNENEVLENNLAEASVAPSIILKSKEELRVLDQYLRAYAFDSLINQELLLAEVSDFCMKNNLIIYSFPHHTSQEKKNFVIHTNVIEAKGSYKNLLNLVYYLEQEIKIGRISSVKFERFLEKKTKKAYLTVKIYVQSIQFN